MSDENQETNESVKPEPYTPPPLPAQKAASALIGGSREPDTPRSFLRNDRSIPATVYHAYGQKWDFYGPSDEAAAFAESLNERQAEAFGITADELKERQFTTTAEVQVLHKLAEETWDIYLDSVLQAWSLPQPCTPESRRELWPDMKRELFDYAVSFFGFGMSEAQFRKARN